MAIPAEVIVLCEGQPAGHDLRSLERARSAIEQGGGMEWVRAVKLVPAGGKGELRSELRLRRRIFHGQPIRFAAIRDRDFLRSEDVQSYRNEAVKLTGDQAWPLARHSVESYLLDPALLASVGVSPEIVASLPAFAAQRLWYDLACSSVEVVRLLANRERIQITAPIDALTSREAAVAAAKRATESWQVRVDSLFVQTGARIEVEIDSDAKDFLSGPLLEHRVHGKDLLATVASSAGMSDLSDRLVRQVERSSPPQSLVDDLCVFLNQLRATF